MVQGRKFSAEFKREAVELTRRPQASVSQVAQELGVLMCRCLKVSHSGYHAWLGRAPSARSRDKARLLERMRQSHAESEGVIGVPRMHERLAFEGESASRNRVARLMAAAGLYGVPQRRRWQRKRTGARPSLVQDQLQRDFVALEPNTKWVTAITYIRTGEGWLYLCVVRDLFSKKVVGWAMDAIQDRNLVLRAVLMALWQREDRSQPVILHSDHGAQCTCEEYQQFLAGHQLVSSMSAVGHCGDNAGITSVWGVAGRLASFHTSSTPVSPVCLDPQSPILRNPSRTRAARLASPASSFRSSCVYF